MVSKVTILDLTIDTCEQVALQFEFDFISLSNFAMTCKHMRDAARLVQKMLKQRENGRHSNCFFSYNRRYYKVDSNAVQHAEYAKILKVPSLEVFRSMYTVKHDHVSRNAFLDERILMMNNATVASWPVNQIHPSQVWVVSGRSLCNKPHLFWLIRIGVDDMLTESDDINILHSIPISVCKQLISMWSKDPSLSGHSLLGKLRPTFAILPLLNPVAMKWEAIPKPFPKTLLK